MKLLSIAVALVVASWLSDEIEPVAERIAACLSQGVTAASLGQHPAACYQAASVFSDPSPTGW